MLGKVLVILITLAMIGFGVLVLSKIMATEIKKEDMKDEF